EQMFKAISTKTERFRYRANPVSFAAGELPEKVSAAEAEGLGRRQRRVYGGGRGVQRQAVQGRRRKPRRGAAQVGHGSLGPFCQPARGLLDQSRSIFDSQRCRCGDLLPPEPALKKRCFAFPLHERSPRQKQDTQWIRRRLALGEFLQDGGRALGLLLGIVEDEKQTPVPNGEI